MVSEKVCERKISVYKAFTWRCTASTITISLVLIYTGQIEAAAAIGAADIVTKLIAYYYHERVWLWYCNTDLRAFWYGRKV